MIFFLKLFRSISLVASAQNVIYMCFSDDSSFAKPLISDSVIFSEFFDD